MKNKIHIVAVNIKTGGGLVLLNELLSEAKKNSSVNCVVYVDNGYEIKIMSSKIKYIRFKGFISKIKLFSRKFDSSLYFGNIPPLFSAGKKSLLYFQNTFYLQPNIDLVAKFQFKFLLQKIYIKYFISNVDTVFVQSEFIAQKVHKYFKIKSKPVPFFKNNQVSDFDKQKLEFDFCYISLPSAAKNFKNLFKALKILDEMKVNLSIALTIPRSNKDLINRIIEFKESNITIENLEEVNHRQALDCIYKSNSLIFPSLLETVGLPLIEACQLNKVVLASNLPYVHQVIIPSMTFNPRNPNEIANCMIKALSQNLKKGKIKIKNNVSEIFRYYS